MIESRVLLAPPSPTPSPSDIDAEALALRRPGASVDHERRADQQLGRRALAGLIIEEERRRLARLWSKWSDWVENE